MELKVREVGKAEQSAAQVEEKLLKENEEKQTVQEEKIVEAAVESKNETEAATTEKKSLEEKDVLEYIRNRYDKPIESFDDLMAKREDKEELPEDIAAYFKYKKETGRGLNDYVKLNRNFEEMNPDVLMSKKISINNRLSQARKFYLMMLKKN